MTNLVNFINGAASNANLTAAQKTAWSSIIATQVGSSGTFTLTARDGGTLGSVIKLGAASSSAANHIGNGMSINGQYTDSTASITGITVSNTNTALTSVTTGGFLSGGTLSFNGTAVTGSTIGTSTTLNSLVANINANTTTSGVHAVISGVASNYTLTLIANNSASTTGVATSDSALSLSQTTALALANSAATLAAGVDSNGTDTITFSGLTSSTQALTEGNSTFANGTLNWVADNTSPTTFTSIGNVTLGTTTLANLASQISATAGFTGTVSAVGSTFVLTVTKASPGSHDGGFSEGTTHYAGALANYNTGGRTADASYTLGGTATTAVAQTVAGLTGGADNGIGINSTVGVGSALDNILVGQNQQPSQVTVTYPNIASSDLNSSSNFGAGTPASITVAGVAFQFTSTASSSATEIQIGSTLQATLDNAVAKINAYVGTGAQNYQFNQISASRNGDSLVIQTRNVGSALDLSGSTVAVTASGSGASVAGTLANGSTSGVNTSGINNAAFVGNVTGFSASYAGTANTVNLSLTVGGITYAASNVTSNPTSNTTVNLVSTDPAGAGGYLSIQMQALDGGTVNSQSDANNIASRLNTAISGLTFYQNRQVSSYDPAASGSSIIANGSPIGSLNGSSISLTSSDFTSQTVQSIAVNAPQGSSSTGSISFTVNGESYNSDSNIGDTLNANTTYKFTNATDPNKVILFKTGSTSIDFSTTDKATAVQTALSKAFGSGSGSALTFQVGSDSTNTIGVSIGSATTSALFGGQALDVLSQGDAAAASTVLQDAVNTVTSLRASVGALEERFNFATSAIQNTVQNEGAAKSTLLDTDVAAASTAFATSQVQLQAGIAVLAQANQLQQNLLKLIA